MELVAVNKRVFRGFKQTEVGLIPEDWGLIAFSEAFDFLTTASFSRASIFTQGDLGYVHYGDIHTKWNFILDLSQIELPKIESNLASRYSLITDGDLIVADASEDYEGIGKSVLVTNVGESKAISGLHTYLLRDRNRYFVDGFRTYIQLFPIIQKQLRRASTGLKVYGISKNNLKNILIPLPTLQEQQAIAQALSDADGLIEKLEKLITKKRQIKQGAMQELLRTKEGWQVLTFGQVFSFLRTATYSRSVTNNEGQVGYIHYGDIHTKWDSIIDFTHVELPKISYTDALGYPTIAEGDIIMADASEDMEGVGKSVEVRNIGSQTVIAGLHTFLLRDKDGVFINGFRAFVTRMAKVKEQFQRLATGLKVYSLSKGTLRNVEIPVPPLDEQKTITAILSDMDAEIEALEAKLEKYRQVKQGMMGELLTGKIRLV